MRERRIGRGRGRLARCAPCRSLRRHQPQIEPASASDDIVRQADHLADIAHGAARPVGDDGGGDPGAVAAVFLIDVLDDLLAPLMLEIDVDVGRLVALRGDEALEQQVEASSGPTAVMPRQ